MQIEITLNGKKPEREVTKPNLIFWKNYEKGWGRIKKWQKIVMKLLSE